MLTTRLAPLLAPLRAPLLVRFLARFLAPLLAFVTASAALPLQAAPTTLDMNNAGWSLSGGGVQTQGFAVNSTNGFAFIGESVNCWPECAHNGSKYIWSGNSAIGVRASDGSAFSLTQFDGAETHMGFPTIWAGAIRVLGQYAAGGTVSAQFNLDGVNDGRGPLDDFQTFFLPTAFTGLSSVTFSVAGSSYGQFALDNIVLNGSFQTMSAQQSLNAIPEPGSLGLACAALLLAAAALHLRRTARQPLPALMRRSP